MTQYGHFTSWESWPQAWRWNSFSLLHTRLWTIPVQAGRHRLMKPAESHPLQKLEIILRSEVCVEHGFLSRVAWQFEADLKQSRSKAWQNYSHMHGLRSSPSSCLPSGWGHSEPGHLAPDFLPSVWVSGLSPWTSLPARVYQGPKQHTHPSTTVRWVYISFFN